MELWTEYEGRTIDGAYPLTKLIRPEGRSAFFSTSNGTGVPTVIRLIESHFDDEEILARWRGIEALNQANLVKLKQFGQVTLDGTSLVYAVMEPVEANLAEIVCERRLTVIEAKQMAASLLAALETLHANGFVHEHVEPANVMAVGETIKLRSDCIREAPEGEAGRAAKARDVHDFAVVLLQALTQQRTLEAAARDLPLAAPFDEIVRKGISGEWDLARIAKALGPIAAPVPAALAASAPAASTRPASAAVPAAVSTQRNVEKVAATGSASTATASRNIAGASRVAAASSSFANAGAGAAEGGRRAVKEEPSGLGRGAALRAVAVFLAVVVLFLAWHFLHSRSAKEGTAAAPMATPAPILENGAASAPVTSATPAAGAPVAEVPREQPAEQKPAVAATGQWHVVAFTYNHEGQAQEKAAALAAKHPGLHPQVFSPTGRAPYLVTLGGGMSREQAFALSGKAKREGLPRDVYAQNYRGR
jgi:hypothetical protein